VNYYQLAEKIASNWDLISNHYGTSPISLSSPTFDDTGSRSISFTSLNDLREERIMRSAGYRFVLRADVRGFYPSLYTHAITWALHGKAAGKRRKATSERLLGDLLDQLVRNGQDRQSIGVPIGPDISHIIAETVAVAIDRQFIDALAKPVAGYRHMDDFFLCFDDRSSAEEALSVLTHTLRDFELDLNEAKTDIYSIADWQEECWPEELDSFSFSNESRTQRREIESFFDKSIALTKQMTDENIIKYAIRRSTRQVVLEENWRLYEAYLAHWCVRFPNTISAVCEIIHTYMENGYELNAKLWKKVAGDMIKFHAPLRHDSEVCWALWLLVELRGIMHNDLKEELSRSNNAFVAVMTLYNQEKGLTRGKVGTSLWEGSAGGRPFEGHFWLLAYEGKRRGWLKRLATALDGHEAASMLDKAGGSFLDEEAALELLFSRVPRVDWEEGTEVEGFEYIFASRYEVYG
jgi:Reverse transcriptase (RNA-dependent DNA polymerase)